MNCPLCCSDKVNKHINRNNVDYFLCNDCLLVFMDPEKQMEEEDKKIRYNKHKNNVSDSGYRSFLMELARPSFGLIDNTKECLDYGCGPTKAMETLFHENGFKMDSYDPLFFHTIKQRQYYLITCNEVVEHFSTPKKDMEELLKWVKKGGFLLIGSYLWDSSTDFANWHYLSDPSHVCFYNAETFKFISKSFGLELIQISSDRVLIFKKI